jgi:cystathionine beta-synthase
MSSSFTAPPLSHSVESLVGHTPLVQLNVIPQSEGLRCNVFAKCEFFSLGGSVKDRIGLQMVLDAEKQGRIKRGDILIEPTSGNTGIGIALAAAIRGYQCIITLPEKMSQEKVNVLKALGAKVIRTPTEAPFDAPESHIGVAKKLQRELKNAHILDQYSNPSNPQAHEFHTADEVYHQFTNNNQNKNIVHVLVATAGTGGTITGMSQRMKRDFPGCFVVGVDPQGSILAIPDSLNDEDRLRSYKIEGIGYDFIPDVLNRKTVDYWVKTKDTESFIMARRLIREEGLLVGGSSGSALVGVLKFLKSVEGSKYNQPGMNIVVVFADSVRNYMAKFLKDKWMIDNGFLPASECNDLAGAFQDGWKIDMPVLSGMVKENFYGQAKIKDLISNHHTTPTSSTSAVVVVPSTLPIKSALELLVKDPTRVLIVRNKGGSIHGVTNEMYIRSALLAEVVSSNQEPLSKMVYPKHIEITPDTLLWNLAKSFETVPFAVDGQSRVVYQPLDLLRWVNNKKKQVTATTSTNTTTKGNNALTQKL